MRCRHYRSQRKAALDGATTEESQAALDGAYGRRHEMPPLQKPTAGRIRWRLLARLRPGPETPHLPLVARGRTPAFSRQCPLNVP